jgi:diadenosine tetraphosphate (Ap4A) HIT family hydrolase
LKIGDLEKMIGADKNCSFCSKFGDKGSNKQKWYDKELISQDNFVVIPAVGAFVEGYLMILTRKHYHNMAQLSKTQLSKLAILKHEVRKILTKYYHAPIAFEHGPGLPAGMGGSCIDHAHIHILPFEFDLLPMLKEYCTMKLVSNNRYQFDPKYKSRPYLLYEDQQGQIYMGNGENIPSQFIRKLIAKRLGISDQWDYALFPNDELIKATINKLEALSLY